MDKKITRSNNKAFFKKSVIAAACLAVAAAAYGFTQTEQTGRSQQVTATSLTISTVQQGEFVDALSLRGQVMPRTT
ncbi:MAG TPA: efflux transporter periplasmic adaptor subunit, partial [Pseudoalteromonas shioyasakiensis]|nr:efflux transporter periplasmic adaptor subunit [Pseudoalteromonas shioyasakiensis]